MCLVKVLVVDCKSSMGTAACVEAAKQRGRVALEHRLRRPRVLTPFCVDFVPGLVLCVQFAASDIQCSQLALCR